MSNNVGSSSASAALDRSDDPWTLAKARFLADLDPSERDIFNNATLENLFYTTSNANRDDAEKSRMRNLATKLGPLVSAIESYGKALDTFAQIAPLYLSPIWGSIRVVLVLARSYGKFFERVVDTLGRIGDVLPRFRDYERIYDLQKHNRLTEALSNAYLDIIVLCTQFRMTIHEQKISSFRRLLKPVSQDRKFDEAIERFRRHKNNVDEEARVCHMIEAADKREEDLILFAAERKRRLLSRLSTVAFEHKHQKFRALRHKGTGVWLTEDIKFRRWQSSTQSSSVLCCYGIPGCGKSVLSSSIVDYLGSSNTVIYYYCDYSDKRTLDPANLFGTLARQVLERVELVPEPLATAIEEAAHDGDRLADASCALRLFQRSLEIYSISIVTSIDGLDEMTETSQKITCQGLSRIIDSSPIPFRLFLTGRENLKALLSMGSTLPFTCISITSSTITSDIGSYVRASTRRRIVEGSLVIQDPSLESEIVDKLVAGAQGMFLWVEFQLCDLCDTETDHGIKFVLENLPKSLSETYDRLLSKIEGKERQDMILRLFKWIVCARQPLHVDELREGVAFTLDDEEWKIEKLPTRFDRLVRACGNLVIVDEEDQIVTFAHYTVQQYLLQEGQDTSQYFRFTHKDANLMAGDFCLAYLHFSNFETRITAYKANARTDAFAISKAASQGPVMAFDHPGRRAVQTWLSMRGGKTAAIEINMMKFVPGTKSSTSPLSTFSFLEYVIAHWLWHTSYLDLTPSNVSNDRHAIGRRTQFFTDLALYKVLPFEFRPWDSLSTSARDFQTVLILGWALMANHINLIETALPADKPYGSASILESAWSRQRAIETINDSYIVSLSTFQEEHHPSASRIDKLVLSRLLLACRKGNLEALQLCHLDKLQDKTLVQFLILATSDTAQIEIIELLSDILDRANLQADFPAARNGSTSWHNALERAVLADQVETVCYLCSRGYAVLSLYRDVESYQGALLAAISARAIRSLECLLAIRENLPFRHVDLSATISSVISEDWLFGANVLLRHIAPQNQAQFLAWLDLASDQITSQVSDLLIETWHELPFRIEPERMTDVLVAAVKKGFCFSVEMLLKWGVNPNIPDSAGCLAMVEAIRCQEPQIVEALCLHKSSLRTTPFGNPLSLAASIGHLEIATILVANGADVFRNTGKEYPKPRQTHLVEGYVADHEFGVYVSPTPLYMACLYGQRDIVNMLLCRGAAAHRPSPSHLFSCVQNESADNDLLFQYEGIGRDGHPFEPEFAMRLCPKMIFEWKFPVAAAIENHHDDIVQILSRYRAKFTIPRMVESYIWHEGRSNRIEVPRRLPWVQLNRQILLQDAVLWLASVRVSPNVMGHVDSILNEPWTIKYKTYVKRIPGLFELEAADRLCELE